MSSLRAEQFDSIKADSHFDVIVIGGGINGIGVYRELALQGLRVLLVERDDFCSGCSAAPSRMIHGGLRYLENGEFSLVKESLRERDNLLRNAPHLVRPLPTTVPIASRFNGIFNAAFSFLGLKRQPRPRGIVPIRIGLMLYDLITRKGRLLPVHSFHSQQETRQRWPALSPRARWTATYHDAWISHPERLAIELIADTKAASPASVALNYAELRPEDRAFHLCDREHGRTALVTADLLVNATGAWLDETISQLSGQESSKRLVSGTKGSHLILDNPALFQALDGHMVFFENTDGRVCVTFPYLGCVLAGSTDIRVDHAGRTRCETEEMDYILQSLRLTFPGLEVTPEQVLFSYSGIRPLPASDQDFTGRISRGHFQHRIDGPVPQICMVGGKWTTFRAFAEQVCDAALIELGRQRLCSTQNLAIGGGRDFPGAGPLAQQLRDEFGIPAERASRLATIYGSTARAFLHFAGTRSDDLPLTPGCPLTGAEIAWIAAREQVEHLTDLILRRSDLAITGRLNAATITAAAESIARVLSWDAARIQAETDALTSELALWHGVSPETLENRNEEGNHHAA
ncbi:glycerol-3-phosphate dehydrogenase/oxidase [Pseudogemmobacter bohemicus]|uniref:glycerol-3-phosphate dehydrogenase/oxidase n=1 Tax=Pseudogemmobacter bohemicus TaxID=2250708 RepID=UPI000DD48033|nr:glycerol-3-phosphate dehydrogenase/oxidase [Pseudogemmobacter bohemicus]